MLVICSIIVAINAGIPVLSKYDVEGTVLKEGPAKYLVDFSKGFKGFKLAGKPEDYSKVLVDKSDCVKE